MTTENQGIDLDSRQAILHILRNPYGWSDEAVRDVRQQAAKELERLWRQERRAQHRPTDEGKTVSAAAKRHLQRVADFGQQAGCIVCGEPFAHLHHILEGRTPGRRSGDFCVVPVCEDCHTGTHGIHGTRQRWSLHKANELEALDRTLEAVYGAAR